MPVFLARRSVSFRVSCSRDHVKTVAERQIFRNMRDMNTRTRFVRPELLLLGIRAVVDDGSDRLSEKREGHARKKSCFHAK